MEDKELGMWFLIGLLTVALIYFAMMDYQEQKEQKELEIHFNGTKIGATNVINFINESEAVPFFLPDGNVRYITFTQLCKNVNRVE